jgi:hypothetical protein
MDTAASEHIIIINNNNNRSSTGINERRQPAGINTLN